MINATAKNEIHVVLKEFLGNRKAGKVAEAVYAVMHTETQHTHNGKMFFINEDSNGELVLTMESMVKEQVEKILNQNLAEDEVQECLKQLMGETILAEKEKTTEIETILAEKEKTTKIETILVEGSESQIYSDLLKYTPNNVFEEDFLEELKKAVQSGFEPFKVPVCDPSIAEDGSLQFVAGKRPAVGYSYDDLQKLARKNNLHLGGTKEYNAFLATIIHRLSSEEGWSKEKAWCAVCCDSTTLGNYRVSAIAQNDFELTGSRKVAGKCDLANTFKILAKEYESDSGHLLAAGSYRFSGTYKPLACILPSIWFVDFSDQSVGWFVLK